MTLPKRFALFTSILAAGCAIWGAYELFQFSRSPQDIEKASSISKIDWNDLKSKQSNSRGIQFSPCDSSLLSPAHLFKDPQREPVNVELDVYLPLLPLFSLSSLELTANDVAPKIFEHHRTHRWAIPTRMSENLLFFPSHTDQVDVALPSPPENLLSKIIPSPMEEAKIDIRVTFIPLFPRITPFSTRVLLDTSIPCTLMVWQSHRVVLKIPAVVASSSLSSYTISTTSSPLMNPLTSSAPQVMQETTHLILRDDSFKIPDFHAASPTTIAIPIQNDRLRTLRNDINEKIFASLHAKVTLPTSILEQLPQLAEDLYPDHPTPLMISVEKPNKEVVKRIMRKNATTTSTPILTQRNIELCEKESSLKSLLGQSKKITALHHAAFNEFMLAVGKSSGSYVETDLLADVQIDHWHEHCSFNLQYMQDPYGQGYFFLVTVEPNFTSTENYLHQNVTFLVDRSNSIEKHRYQTFKKAVLRAINELDASDSFNILLFDHQVVAFQKENVPATSTAIERAEAFLESHSHGNFLAAGDVYKTLRHLIPAKIDTKELHSAILITDGNSLLATSKKQKAIQRWRDQFFGSVNLFTAAVGKGNDLTLLSLLSCFGQGRMIYSDTHAGFPRKVATTVRALRAPLAKNLHAFVKSSTMKADLLSDNQFTPPLFNHQPLSFLGYTQDLSDFTFVLEGKNKDGWFEIRKPFSFRNAKAVRAPIEKAIELQRAQVHYRRFLEKGLEQDLEQAEDCLKSAEARWNFE